MTKQSVILQRSEWTPSESPCGLVENILIPSIFLQRDVKVDFYIPKIFASATDTNLLLINDGQNLDEMHFSSILEELFSEEKITPLVCVGIHAGTERKMEYGVASQRDYLGRGAKAGLYTSFVLKELLPFIYQKYSSVTFTEKAFLGFSLGGLMAMDIVWNHPDEFSKAGVFSGSFWWRSVDQHDKRYNDNEHRIMQQQVRHARLNPTRMTRSDGDSVGQGKFSPGLQFFLQCGNKDETRDRNKNGIIDSVDDTLDIIKELVSKGYDKTKDIFYLEIKDGRHDIATWAKVMPEFLKWGWGRKNMYLVYK